MVLIIVDCQNDFILDNAPLKVEGALSAIDNIIKLINSKTIDEVIFTADWHPKDHCSFKENGGIWPRHCVQHTDGANLYTELFKTCVVNELPMQILDKGEMSKVEEYGAVSNIIETSKTYIIKSKTDSVSINKTSNIIVCGIAGDYCVLETLKGLKDLNPKVYLEGIASIDNGEKLNKYIKENNIEIYDSKINS